MEHLSALNGRGAGRTRSIANMEHASAGRGLREPVHERNRFGIVGGAKDLSVKELPIVVLIENFSNGEHRSASTTAKLVGGHKFQQAVALYLKRAKVIRTVGGRDPIGPDAAPITSGSSTTSGEAW